MLMSIRLKWVRYLTEKPDGNLVKPAGKVECRNWPSAWPTDYFSTRLACPGTIRIPSFRLKKPNEFFRNIPWPSDENKLMRNREEKRGAAIKITHLCVNQK